MFSRKNYDERHMFTIIRIIKADSRENSACEYLDLSDNNFGNQSINQIIPEMNLTLNSLKRLSLSNNLFTDLSELLYELVYNQTLTNLDFSGNRFGDDTAQALASLIKNNNIISGIWCRNGNISRESYDAIIKALEENITLYSFDCYSSTMTEEQRVKLNTLIIRNRENFPLHHWSPHLCISFTSNSDSNQLILTTLLCNSEYNSKLPIRVWTYIFSFWIRKMFMYAYRNEYC